MRRPIRLLFALLACAGVLPAADILTSPSSFAIDPAQTKVEFIVGSTLHTIHGTFALKRGNLRFDPSTGKASGELLVDAGSGESGSSGRDKRMQGHILESLRFPEIAFRPDRVEGAVAVQGRSEVRLHGVFVIHGDQHEMTLPLTVDAVEGQYRAATSFTIPYIKWGMKNPSTLMLRVNDRVEITVHTIAHTGS